jgi:hypothetical protein
LRKIVIADPTRLRFSSGGPAVGTPEDQVGTEPSGRRGRSR